MSISINKDDNIKVNVTETGWAFFRIKGSERMSDGLYKDVFTYVTLKFAGDVAGFRPKNQSIIHIDNAKITFDLTKDIDGNKTPRLSLLVFNCSTVQEGIDEFYVFKKFSKEVNQESTPTPQTNDSETLVGADDMLPF